MTPLYEQRDVRSGMVLAVACLCQVMVVLDVSVVNVALPSIATDLHFTSGGLSWVVNAYTLAFGGLLLLGGRFSDLIGHRAAVFVALGLFAVASVLGGFAQNATELVVARAGQGVAAAVLAPLTLTLLMVTFAEGPQRTHAIGIWSMVAAGGSALGVLLGGVLTEWLSWRWVLFVNVPITVLAGLLAVRCVRDVRTHSVRRLDVLGAVFATAAVTALVYGMIAAGDHGWGSPATMISLVAAVVLGALFVWWETATDEPLLRFGIMRTRSVWVACVIVLLIGVITIGGFYFSSLFLQRVLGYTPISAGLAFLPFCLGTVVGAVLARRLVAKTGARRTMTAGLVLGAVGMLLFSRLSVHSTFVNGFLLPSIVASVGIGACMVANMSLGTTGVAHHEAGMVSGVLNAARQIGGSIGLAALATAAAARAASSHKASPLGAMADGYSLAFVLTAALALAAAFIAAIFVPAHPPVEQAPDGRSQESALIDGA